MFYSSRIRQFLSFFFIVSTIVILSNNSFAQSGPGGVGNADGSNGQPENVIWYAADSLNLSNSDQVSQWDDISGNNNNGTQATSANRPEYLTGQINGLPVVSFDGTDDHILYNGSLIANSDYTFITVAQRRSNSGRQIITGGSTGATNENLHFFWYNTGTTLNSHHYGNDFESALINNTESYSGGTDQNEYGIFSTLLNSGAGYREHLQNDSILDTHTNGTQLSSYNGAAIGRYAPTNDYGNIDVAEVIVYSSPLNHAQLTIVHNYLSEKYNINIVHDLFADTADYDHFIAGIGKESNGAHEHAFSDGMYISQNGGLDDGEYLFASNDSAVNHVDTLKTGSRVTNTGAEAAWNREWFIEQTGDFNVTFAFDFSEGIENGKYPQELSSYILLHRADTASDYSEVSFSERGIQNSDQVYFNVSSTDISNGYYTLASKDTTASPLQGDEAQTWYSLKSGDWSDANTWTLDPSGALPDNPANEIPGETDKVEILSGNEVTVQPTTDSINLLEASIKGRLNLTTTEGHNFGLIEGDGKVLMAADNFPDGDATGFVSDEGVVEYYGNSYVLDTARTFYDVTINMNSVSDTLTLLDDYTIKGDLTLEQGTFRINDNTSTTILNLEVFNDVVVENQGKIITGEGNTVNGNYSIGGTMPDDDGKEFHDIFHQFIIKGNFTNNGTVRLTNLNAPDYNDFASNGAVTVRFKGASDANVTLNDTTDFYFLIIDKGTDKTYTAEIYSDHTRYFQLFGPNNCGRLTTGSYTDSNPLLQKALWVKTGTLKLTGNIHIPTLSEGQVSGGNGDYAVGENARFLMAGPSVTVYSTANNLSQILHFTSSDTYQANGITSGSSNQAMSIYGEYKITDGFFGTRNSAGFIFWPASNAQVKIEGGECHVAQMRSAGGGSGVASYSQSGGTVYAFGNEGPNGGEYNGDYPLFGLQEPAGVFQMSGGEIILQDHDGDADPEFYIPSLESNHNVTGGLVKFELNGGSIAQFSSTSNIWNLELTKTSGAGDIFVELDTTLKVSNDLVIGDGTTNIANVVLDHKGYDVFIGGDFTIGTDGAYYFGDQYSEDPSADDVPVVWTTPAGYENTTTFNGTNPSTISLGNLDPDDTDACDQYNRIQPFHEIVIDKPSDVTVTLEAPNRFVTKNTITTSTTGGFRVESGIFDNGDYSVFLNGSIVNRGQLGVYIDGTDEIWSLLKFPQSDTEIITEEGATFGNVRLSNDANILSFTSDVTIQRLLYTHGRIYLGSHQLTLENLDIQLNGTAEAAGNCSGCFSIEDMIATNGKASDGGLRIKIPTDGNNSPGSLDNLGSCNPGSPVYNFPDNSNFPDATFNEDYFLFPIGIRESTSGSGTVGTDYFTPLLINIGDVSGATDGDEYITVNPVKGELKTTDLSGGAYDSLTWRVRTEGFSGDVQINEIKTYGYNDLMSNYANSGVVDEPDASTNNSVSGGVLDDGDYERFGDEEYANDPDLGGLATENAYGPHFEIVYDGANDNVESDGTTTSNDYSEWGDASSTTVGVGPINLTDVNLTFAEEDRFDGSPEIYYSVRNSGWGGNNWDNTDSWYETPNGNTHPTDYPTAGDIAVIRGDHGTDAINVNGNQEAAEVIFQREGTYSDIEDLPRLRFNPTDQLTVGKISGVGDLYLRQDIGNGPTLNADIGEFAANDTSLIEFYLWNDDGTYNVDLADFFDVLPTLRVYGNNADYDRIVSFNYDMSLKNLIVDGEAVMKMAGNYTVESRTRLGFTGGGRIEYPNGTDSYTLKTGEFVTGRGKDQQDNDFRVTVDGGGGNGIEHIFEVERDINLNFPGTVGGEGSVTFDLFSTMNDNNVILKLSGTGDYSFIDNYSPGNSTIEFYKIEMNKGSDTTSSFTFEDDFTLSGPTQGVNVEKALNMKNGTLILDDPDINIDLTTGDDDFYIPSASALEIRQGQVNASGNSGILLDGKLNVNGGIVDMSGGDNYIEYSSSGNATIEISSGTLTVGSQIRRKTTTQEGILNYNQSGGTVVVGENSAPEDNRGVFEIMNSGSNFELTGGELYIANAQNNPSIASLYLDPASSNLTTGGKIVLGHSSTGNNQTIGINSNISIPKLFVDDVSGNSPEVKMRVIELTVTDSLNIGAGTSFDTDGLNLRMEGDFIAEGSYFANGNKTYFEGNTDQEITGKTQFYDLYKTSSDSLFLNDSITINNVFRLEDGVLHDRGNNLAVKGNIYNNGIHVWGDLGDGILANGSENQEITGNGTYGKLSVNNVEGMTIPVVGNNIYINDALQMENGVLDIGKNLLELDSNAVIVEKSAFSDNNMVQTNISFTDAGIRKYFPKIEKDTTFTYPLGSGGKYTPVVFDIDSSLQHGYIRVKAANERHPSIQEDSESPCELKDSLNVLQYHWLIEAQNISGFDANVSMYADKEDIWVNNSCGYTTAEYITARLLENSVLWNKFDPFSFDESASRLDFKFSEADDGGLTGDYTAGIDSIGFDGAIPDSVPVYHSAQNGNWKDNTTWEEDIAGGPRGAIVIIDDSVTVTKNYLVSYKTILEPSGILLVNSTFGHRLGLVEGQGTLSTWRGDLPAADYEEFFSDTGGTLEYAGTNNLNILSGIPALNNLRFVNTGIRRFPNQDITLYGNLEIVGDDNSLNVINEYDKTFTIQENITFDKGSFDAGSGTNAEVILNGNSLQTITGRFEGSNAFNHLTLQNSSGLEVQDSVEIDETFTLNDGMVYLPDTGLVTLNSTADNALSGANSSRYIQGPLRKQINNGDTYTFEVGDTSRYGRLELSTTNPTTSEYWEVQYYDNNPDNYGYDTSQVIDPLIQVSGNEFWRVQGPAGATADVEIRWDDESVLPAMVDRDSLHIAKWRSDRWKDVGNIVTDNGLNNGYVRTDAPEEVDGDSIFTLASAQTLPKATAAFLTTDTSVCKNGAIALRVKVTGEPDITFTINKGASHFGTYTVTNEGDTTIVISNNATTSDAATYAIDSVGDVYGQGVVYGDSVTVTVQSPPSPVIDLGDTTACQNTTHIYRVPDNSDYYYSWSVPNGNMISGSNSHQVQVEWQNNGMQSLVDITTGLSSLPGCETTVDTAVNVYETPEPTVTASPTEICYPDTIDLDAGDSPTGLFGFNYTWTPDSVNNQTVRETYFAPTGNLNVASETINFKVVIENAGRTGCSVSDSIDATIYRKPESGDMYYVPSDFDL